MSFNADDNECEAESLHLSPPGSPTNITEEVGNDLMPATSTNEPLRKQTSSKRKQAEEEIHLLQNLSQSIENKNKRRREGKKKNNTIFEAFGNYVAQVLSELDSRTGHLAQHKISNIIFQAQAGLLSLETMMPPSLTQTVTQPQRNYFHPVMQPGMLTSPPPSIYGENSASYRDDNY